MDQGAKTMAKLKGASLGRKAKLLQEVYESVAFSDSGIMYSMLRLEADGIRPFVPADSVHPQVGGKCQFHRRCSS